MIITKKTDNSNKLLSVFFGCLKKKKQYHYITYILFMANFSVVCQRPKIGKKSDFSVVRQRLVEN